MMTNLFSIFDTNTNHLLEMNWLSSLSNLLILPYSYWFFYSKMMMIFNNINLFLNNEFKIIFKNKFNNFNKIYFIAMFMFIASNNLMGLFPYIFTSSSHMIFSMMLSLPLWFTLMTFMMKENINLMYAHLIPQGTPIMLMPFMVMIETISNIIRPMTLSIRLTANMIAGHLLLTLLSQSTNSNYFSIMILTLLTQIIMLTLEMSVSLIQSYVFSILSVLYSKETN